MKFKNLILGLSCSASLFSCQVKVGQLEPSTAASFEGKWSTQCMANSNDSYRESISIGNGSMTRARLIYTGSRSCELSALSLTEMVYGQYKVTGNDLTTNTAVDFTWELSVISIIPNTAAKADDLNAANTCGVNTWASDQATFVFSCNLGPELNFANVTPATVHYGAYNISSNVTPALLQFSDDCALSGFQTFCPSESDRPSSFSGLTFFKEQ